MLRLLTLLMVIAAAPVSAQGPPPAEKPPAVEKLSATTYRIGRLHVDTARREVVVPGTVNEVSTLEFVANTRNGAKAYESAFTLDTGAISFNAALLLVGLDPSRSKPSMMQFDPNPPQGDPVEIEVEWQAGGKSRRVKVDELLYDQRSKKTLPPGPWVYTGSTFYDPGDGRGRVFLAEIEGVLIGLMHGPQALIDNPRNDAVGGYGAIVLNPNAGLSPNTAVTLTVRALPVTGKQKR